jgi:hypothetical protein
MKEMNMPKSLSTRLERLEASQPEEPLVVRITSFADPPSPEEEAVLEAEVQRRLAAGESLIVMLWSGRRARRLGGQAPGATDGQERERLGVTLVSPGRQAIEL